MTVANGSLIVDGPQDYPAGSMLTVNGGSATLRSDAGSPAVNNLSVAVNPGGNLLLDSEEHLQGLTINNGSVLIPFGPVHAIFLHSPLSLTGRLDLGYNDIIEYFTGDPHVQIERYRQWIVEGLGGANGLIFTEPSAYPAMYTVLDNRLAHLTTFDGRVINDGVNFDQLIVAVAYVGDTNLSGSVTQEDLLNVVANMGRQATWFEGDVDMDGVVTPHDYQVVLDHLGNGTAAGAAQLALVSPSAKVLPEPHGLLALAAVLALTRRRRRT
ncbi:MAG: hypothetical protein ACHRHE_23630 [Tepidisphaerales bacterium]